MFYVCCGQKKRSLLLLFSFLVPGTGLEPARIAPYAPQTYVSTSSTTRAGVSERKCIDFSLAPAIIEHIFFDFLNNLLKLKKLYFFQCI